MGRVVTKGIEVFLWDPKAPKQVTIFSNNKCGEKETLKKQLLEQILKTLVKELNAWINMISKLKEENTKNKERTRLLDVF